MMNFILKIWKIRKFIFLKSKACCFQCGNENIYILKVISKSQSKNKISEGCNNCLFGSDSDEDRDIFNIQ